MSNKTRNLIRCAVLYSKWNASKIVEIKNNVIIVSGLYPFKEGKAIHLPFLFDNCLIKIKL